LRSVVIMRPEFRAGYAFSTAIELLLIVCLLVSCAQIGLGGGNYDEAWSIQPTADGGYVVAGHTYSNKSDADHGFSDHWKVLLNPSSNMEWQKRIGENSSEDAHIAKKTSDGGQGVAGRAGSNNDNASSHLDSCIVQPGKINCTLAATDWTCSGSAGNVASTAESADTYAWFITNGAITSESNAQSISFTAGASGTTRLTLIVTKMGIWNKCHKEIAIKPRPECSWGSNAPVCNGTAVRFTGPSAMDAYQWEFGDGQTGISQDPVHLYPAPGTYAVTLKAAKGSCWSDCTREISIVPGPDCSWSSNAPVCNGTPVQFSGPAGMDDYRWEFGDGEASSERDPAHLYPAPGSYMVNLTAAKGGCSRTCSGIVEVRPTPDCSWSSNAPVCNGTPLQFSGPAGMDSYLWEFGDGQTSSERDPAHLYNAPGSYMVNLATSKGDCSRTCSGIVEVSSHPDCSWSSNAPVCNGTPLQFSGPAGMDSYLWEFGDGQTSSERDPAHLYSAVGSYDVSLLVGQDGCSKECAKEIAILSGPECSSASNPSAYNETPAQSKGPPETDSRQLASTDGQASSIGGRIYPG
jgi:PKD repeat protein